MQNPHLWRWQWLARIKVFSWMLYRQFKVSNKLHWQKDQLGNERKTTDWFLESQLWFLTAPEATQLTAASCQQGIIEVTIQFWNGRTETYHTSQTCFSLLRYTKIIYSFFLMGRSGRKERPSLCRAGIRETAKMKEPHVKVESSFQERWEAWGTRSRSHCRNTHTVLTSPFTHKPSRSHCSSSLQAVLWLRRLCRYEKNLFWNLQQVNTGDQLPPSLLSSPSLIKNNSNHFQLKTQLSHLKAGTA